MDEDQALMARVRGGDREAFVILYERYKRPVMSYLYSMVLDPAAAEDLTQEAFLRVFRARATWEPRAKFSTWLWTIARNATFDHLRRDDDRAAAGSTDVEALESPLPHAEAQLLERVDRARLESCVAALTAAQREALALRTASELSYDEIAQLMGTSLASVKSLLNRAKTALIDCLKQGADRVHAKE